jgi:predicted NAD/FAD-dependent oxidoreductase
MNSHEKHTVIVVGAGMAGLVAARKLRASGRPVVVLDKGRGVGGRIATRRIEDATFDHGAQFFTIRDPDFERLAAEWITAGAAAEWCHGFGQGADGHLRFRGAPAMNAIAKHLAAGLNIRTEAKVVSIYLEPDGWRVRLENGQTLAAGSLLLTAPVPQSLALLETGGVNLPAELERELKSITYDCCLAVMVRLVERSALKWPGALQLNSEPIAWLADNQIKGVSVTPSVTIHAGAKFSSANWDRDRQDVGRELLAAARTHIGSAVKDFQVHGWRYSKPIMLHRERCVVAMRQPLLVLAGDAFGAARVEGAALSGLAAATVLL